MSTSITNENANLYPGDQERHRGLAEVQGDDPPGGSNGEKKSRDGSLARLEGEGERDGANEQAYKGEQYQLGQECAVVCPPPWKQMVRNYCGDAADKSAGNGAKPTRHRHAKRIGHIGLRESSGQHEQDNKKNAANDPEETGGHADDTHQGWLFTGVGYVCKKQIDEERA